MSYSNEWLDRGLYRTYSGTITPEEIREALNDMYSDERFDSLDFIISDYLHIDGVDIDEDTILRKVTENSYLNYAASKSNADMKLAIVAQDETIRTLANFYDSVSAETQTTWKTKIFHSIEDAEDWASSADT